MRDQGRWISACGTLRFVSRLYWRPVKRNGRIITAVTGCGYGSDSISGDAIVLAQGGELLLHLSHHFVCGLLLLPSAQRHPLHTRRQRGHRLSCTRFFKTVKYFHLILNKNTGRLTLYTNQWWKWQVWIDSCLDFRSLNHVVNDFNTSVHPDQLVHINTKKNCKNILYLFIYLFYNLCTYFIVKEKPHPVIGGRSLRLCQDLSICWHQHYLGMCTSTRGGGELGDNKHTQTKYICFHIYTWTEGTEAPLHVHVCVHIILYLYMLWNLGTNGHDPFQIRKSCDSVVLVPRQLMHC